MPAIRWIFLTFIFLTAVSTENNCYKKNLCYGRDRGSICANSTTLVTCNDWQDFPTTCEFGCKQKTADVADCGCLNNCSGIGTCMGSMCRCPPGYTGADCSSKSICAGLSDGNYCFNNTYIWCANQQVTYQFPCKFGCSKTGCHCPNNCSGFTCDTYGSCQCPANRTGYDCSIINPCKANINTYVCLNATTSATCSGTYLYSIVNCPYGCKHSTGNCDCSPTCKLHGSCGTSAICNCDVGYYGTNCDQVSPCYDNPGEYGYSCQGNQRIYCSSSGYSVTVTNCSTACVTEHGYSQCQCDCDDTHDKYSYCSNSGTCTCNNYWTGPHCWTLPISARSFGVCAGGSMTESHQMSSTNQVKGIYGSTFCNGSSLVTCSGNTVIQTVNCQYGCVGAGLGNDRCSCPIGENGLECSGAGRCVSGVCLCNKVGVRPDCSPDPCSKPGLNNGLVCANSYTAAQCMNYKTWSTFFCSGGCKTLGTEAECIMDCGPNGSSRDGSCKCSKGYSECPIGFRGDTCQEPISACSFTNGTAPVSTVCSGNQALTCVQRTAVNATACTEGCLDGKCICNRENNCSGHGTCLNGACQCDIGWSGAKCQNRVLTTCEKRTNGRYCANNNVTGEVFWCFKQMHVGGQTCEGLCSEETASCSCPFDCHGHGACRDGVCLCTGLWFGPYCKYSGFTIALQIVGAVVLLGGVLLGFFMVTSHKHTRTVPVYKLDQARKTDYDFSDEEVVLMDSHVEGYQSMGPNAFHRLFKKRK